MPLATRRWRGVRAEGAAAAARGGPHTTTTTTTTTTTNNNNNNDDDDKITNGVKHANTHNDNNNNNYDNRGPRPRLARHRAVPGQAADGIGTPDPEHHEIWKFRNIHM